MNNEISNPKVEVPSTMKMNDYDYLMSLLECEKNMSTDLNIALNEASNQSLYNELYDIYDLVREAQRDLYETCFAYGWYKLEKAENNKISKKLNELSSKLGELPQD
ncbi:MAG: spore coat protein [Bacilli bacterium]|nr:spore coat protein [Bacilli bacterium]